VAEAIGIDLGGTNVRAGIVDEHGVILKRAEARSELSDADALRRGIVELVRDLAADDVAGIGVGAAGLIDFERGRYLFGPNTGLHDLDLAEMLTHDLGRAVRLDNDANCAAWAEHRFGAGRGTSHLLCVTLGTGIGGGIVIDGRPYRGAHGSAGEIGHILVDPSGPECGCGRRGCWEQLASGNALGRLARERLSDGPGDALLALADGVASDVTGHVVTRAARNGDRLALDVVADVARWIGWGLGSLVNVLEPERIAIGGGLADEWDLFAGDAVAAMTERAEASQHRPMPDVVVAELGSDAGLVGAALLVLDG
jgi:glucokinase